MENFKEMSIEMKVEKTSGISLQLQMIVTVI